MNVGRGIVLLAILGVLGIGLGTVFAEEIAIPTYLTWDGKESSYSGVPPMFFIRDIDAETKFWATLKDGDPMPHVDFGKYMLFVWAPGATMFDWVPVRLVRFLRDETRFTLLMDCARKDSGGYWRGPYLVVMLPKLERGDVQVLRVGDRRQGEAPRMPLGMIWEMRFPRTDPVVAVGPAKPWHPPGAPQAPVEKPLVLKAPPPIDETRALPPASSSVVNPATGTAATTAGGTNLPASRAADPFGDAFNLDF